MHVGMSSEQRESNKVYQHALEQQIRRAMRLLTVTDLRLASLQLLQWCSLIIVGKYQKIKEMSL